MLRFFRTAFLLLITHCGDRLAYPNLQEESYGLEKLYLHTDRGIYSDGQEIYFKAYLVNSVTHVRKIEQLTVKK